MEEPLSYLRCRTCGRYVESKRARGGYYCSEACRKKYSHCPNCGRFFETSSSEDSVFCSLECRESWEKPLIGIAHIKTEEEGVLV